MKSNTSAFRWRYIFFVALILTSVFKSSAGVFKGVKRIYQDPGCEKPEGDRRYVNKFGLGTAGATCRAQFLGNAFRATFLYPDFIVDGEKLRDPSHVKEYGAKIANLIDEMAYDFLKNREGLDRADDPISDEEMKNWLLFIKAIAYQESLFTHYQLETIENRKKDAKKRRGADKEFNNENEIDISEVARLRILVGDEVINKDPDGEVFVLDAKGRRIYRAKGMFQVLDIVSPDLAKSNFDLVRNIDNGIAHVYNHWKRLHDVSQMRPKLAEAYFDCKDQRRDKKRKDCSKERLKVKPDLSCSSLVEPVEGKFNYLPLLRAAYGMYNGGDLKICRFVKSDELYAQYRRENPLCDIDKAYVSVKGRAAKEIKKECEDKQKCKKDSACTWVNDIRFERNARLLMWQNQIGRSDEDRMRDKNKEGHFEFRFDLNCMRKDGRFCLRAESEKSKRRQTQDFLEALDGDKSRADKRLFTMDLDVTEAGHLNQEKNFCVYDKTISNFICTTQEKWVPCLRNKQDFPLKKIMSDKGVAEAYYTLYQLPFDDKAMPPVISDDPNLLCSGSADGVFTIGQYITVRQNLKIRKTKEFGGQVLGVLSKGESVQILDFDVFPGKGLERWYKVSITVSTPDKKGRIVEGFIYGGDDYNWSSYMQEALPQTIEKSKAILPRVGDSISIVNDQIPLPQEDDKKSGLTLLETLYSKVDRLTPNDRDLKVLDIQINGPDQKLILKVGGGTRNILPVQIQAGQLRTNGSIRESISHFIKIESLTGSAP